MAIFNSYVKLPEGSWDANFAPPLNPAPISESRFGIGDVYFLALSMGKCEVVVDDVTRSAFFVWSVKRSVGIRWVGWTEKFRTKFWSELEEHNHFMFKHIY